MLQEYSSKQEGRYTGSDQSQPGSVFIEYLRQSHNPNGSISGESNYTQGSLRRPDAPPGKPYRKHKSVSEYAALLNLSIYQLNSITKTSVGKTVSELINEQIVLEAKRYLLASSSQVKEIADQLGYEDPSYFVRFFKKQNGLFAGGVPEECQVGRLFDFAQTINPSTSLRISQSPETFRKNTKQVGLRLRSNYQSFDFAQDKPVAGGVPEEMAGWSSTSDHQPVF